MILLKLLQVFLSLELAIANSGITYHGRLVKPDGTPVTSSNVQFRMQIRTPGTQDCLMYEEIQTLDLSTTNGMFALSLNDGTGVRQDGYSWGLFDALANRKAFTFNAADCSGVNTYSPDPDDNRKFRVFFNDGTFTGWEALPIQTINFIPMSIESYAVGGFPASSLLRVETAGTLGTTSPLTATQYSEILALLNGTSSQYEKDGELNGSAIPTLTAGQTVTSDGSGGWVAATPLTSESDPTVEAFAKASLPTCGANEVLKSDGTSLSCVTDAGGWSAVDATTTVKGIVNVPVAGGLEVTSGAISLPDVVTGGTYTKVTVDAKGRVTTGANITGSDITSGTIGGSTAINTSGTIATSGSITSGSLATRQIDLYDSDNTHHISFLTPATTDLTTDYDLIFPATLGTSNQVLGMNNAGTALENKSITAGTGVTVTHSTGGIQISATGSGGTVTSVSGTSPISVATGTTTPVISLDNSGVTAATYGSSTQVPVFAVDAKDRVTSVTNTTITGVSPVGSTLSNGQAWVGDGSNTAQSRFIGFADLKTSLAGNAFQIPTTCTSSQVMTYSAVTDVFSCTNISITASQVSDLSTELADYVEVAGDTMTGSLNLPANGLVVGTDQLVASGGNVGVGTSNPGEALEVSGRIASNPQVDNSTGQSIKFGIASDATNTANSFGLGDPSLNLAGTSTTQTNTLRVFGTNGRTLNVSLEDGSLFVKTGNVGIGTTNPDRKLVVADSSNSAAILISGKTTTTFTDIDGLLPPSGSKFGGIIEGGSLGQLILGIRSNDLLDGLSILSANNNYSTNGGVYERSVAFFRSDGNVGIGTTSPIARLHVGGTATYTGAAGRGVILGPTVVSDTSGNGGIQMSPRLTPSTVAAGGIVFGNIFTPKLYNSAQDVTYFYGSYARPETDATYTGTAAQVHSLFLASPILNGGTVTNIYGLTIQDMEGGTNEYSIYQQGSDDINYFAGKVGIGTTNPAQRLDVIGGIQLRSIATEEMAGFSVDDTTGNLNVHYNSVSNNQIAVTIDDANGNVGIGTTNPEDRLHLFSTGNTMMRLDSGATLASMISHYNGATAGAGISMFPASDSRLLAVLNNDLVNNNAPLMILRNGNVGIGTNNPTAKLQVGVSGDGSVAIANAWNTFSDIRLKTNITKIENACEIVDHLNGYYYNWKNAEDQSRQVGVIAQEVQEVLPELVQEGPDGILTVDYPKLTAVLIEAVKEIREENQSLGADNADLRRELASVKMNSQRFRLKAEKIEIENAELKARLQKIEKALGLSK